MTITAQHDLTESKSVPAGSEPAPLSLIICGLAIGTLLGAFAPAIDQRGIDGALVLAGIINYPPQAPLVPYFLDSWTSIHQIGALLLRAGIAQITSTRCSSCCRARPWCAAMS